MHKLLHSILFTIAVVIGLNAQLFAQTAPFLGTAASYGAFAAEGKITNTGPTVVKGSLATEDSSISGFPPGTYTGEFHPQEDSVSVKVKDDVIIGYNQAGNNTCDSTLIASLGIGQTLTSHTYCTTAATTLTGDLTLDAKGNPNAIFIFKIGGSLNAVAGSKIILVNGAKAANVYWRVTGTTDVHDSAIFKGTILGNNTIHLYNASNVDGRLLAVNGDIILATTTVSVPSSTAPATLTVIRPSAGDTLLGGTYGYQIRWTGSGINNHKTIAYSLDSGKTWKTIATIDSNVFAYNWNVPDSASNNALVRVTDAAGVVGTSGLFTIKSSKVNSGNLVVIRPAYGEGILGGTQNYQIVFTGSNLTKQKTLEYSLDNGQKWHTIGVLDSNVYNYPWNVPDTSSTQALVRITDNNGARGVSGVFTIISSKSPAIVVVRPSQGEYIQGGTQNYQITFTGSGIASQKTFEYSLDGGTNWIVIGTANSNAFTYSWNVPDTSSTHALVRVTDHNGLRGVSGMFTILSNKTPSIVFTHPLGGEVVTGGTPNYQISWTGSGIAAQKLLEYSLDGGLTWHVITMLNSDVTSYSWNVPDTTSQNAVVRLTDRNGLTGKSGMFTIQSGRNPVLIVTHPASGESLQGGTQNYTISFEGQGVSSQKTIEFSSDNGATWTFIGFTNTDGNTYNWQNVPNITTSLGRIRVTDINGVSGTSGMFSITASPGDGNFTSLCLGGLIDNQIPNDKHMTIDWTYNGDIGTFVDVQYSLDNTETWNEIATVPTSGASHLVWTTPANGYYPNAVIRIVSSKGIRIISPSFMIGGTPNSVAAARAQGFSLTNYPNPVSSQTTISFALPTESNVTLVIADFTGREVGTILSQNLAAGMHNVKFNASTLASGVYTYMLRAGSTVLTGRMNVVR